MVIERNWLEVYPYTKWGGNANLPVFQMNERFTPNELLLRDVSLPEQPSDAPILLR